MRHQRVCIDCWIPLEKSIAKYKGLKFEALQCPKCKEKIFTEEMAKNVAILLDRKRLEEEYIKHPMKIGNSWGITFPRNLAEVFSLDNPKTRLRIHPHVEKGSIEVTVDF